MSTPSTPPAGRATVEIDPGESAVSDLVDVRLRAGARVALEAVVAARESGPCG